MAIAIKRVDVGDRVKLSCVGQLENKAHLGTTRRRILEFKVGGNSVLAGLEKGVLGMAVGERKSFIVRPEEGYGVKRPGLVRKVPRSRFPEHIDLQVGKFLKLKQEDGSVQKVQIAALEDDVVILDANHPLAGEILRFYVKVIAIG
jgi:peptidylprolyl isomerase